MPRHRALPYQSLLITILCCATAQAGEWVFGNGYEDQPIAGNYLLSIQSVIDPCGQRPFTGDPPAQITVAEIGPGQFRMTGASPWVTLNGAIAAAAPGTASLSGTGTIAGFAGVTATYAGIVHQGTLLGTLTWGAGNELPCAPGQPDKSIKFSLSGTRFPG